MFHSIISQYLGSFHILFTIWSVSLIILKCVLEHCNSHNSCQWVSTSWYSIRYGNWSDGLHVRDNKEITIRCFLELCEQVQREKSKKCIFRCSNSIVGKWSIQALVVWILTYHNSSSVTYNTTFFLAFVRMRSRGLTSILNHLNIIFVMMTFMWHLYQSF